MTMDVGPGTLVRCIHRRDRERKHTLPDVGPAPVPGGIYTVKCVWPASDYPDDSGIDGVELCEFQHIVFLTGEPPAWDHDIFAPLPDISEWLETSTSYEEPRRVPAPREVEGV